LKQFKISRRHFTRIALRLKLCYKKKSNCGLAVKNSRFGKLENVVQHTRSSEGENVSRGPAAENIFTVQTDSTGARMQPNIKQQNIFCK